MRYFINTTKAVINIGGHTVIAPTKAAAIDPEGRGVKDLIKRGLLVEAEGPAGEGAETAGGDEAAKEPSTVPQLKAWLDKQEITYPPDAKKPELQALYEALKDGGEQ